jgi:hypothetical protein
MYWASMRGLGYDPGHPNTERLRRQIVDAKRQIVGLSEQRARTRSADETIKANAVFHGGNFWIGATCGGRLLGGNRAAASNKFHARRSTSPPGAARVRGWESAMDQMSAIVLLRSDRPECSSLCHSGHWIPAFPEINR